MSEEHERDQAAETGGENTGTSDTLDEAVRGGDAANPAAGTPPVEGDDQSPGQTQTPAADDDVGVPEEIDDRTE